MWETKPVPLEQIEQEIAEGEQRIYEIENLLAEGHWSRPDLAALLELLGSLHLVVGRLRNERLRAG